MPEEAKAIAEQLDAEYAEAEKCSYAI